MIVVMESRVLEKTRVGGTRPKVYNDPTSCIKHRNNYCHFRFTPTLVLGVVYIYMTFVLSLGGVLENQVLILNLVLPLGGVLENRLPILNLVLTPPSVFRVSI